MTPLNETNDLPKYIQMSLFPPTFEEIITIRVNEFERKIREIDRKTIDKTERLRKGQYAKIGALEKRCKDLEERLQIMERHICQSSRQEKNECEIVGFKAI